MKADYESFKTKTHRSMVSAGLRPEHDGATEPTAELVRVQAYCEEAFALAADRGWRSHDPFDLLLAPAGEWMRRRSRFAARCLVQIGMRSGPRLRWLAGVHPHQEAKAVADFVAAGVVLARRPETAWAREYTPQLIARLERLAIHSPHGLAWGLGFPYASRFVSVPAGTPNAYTTICCVGALTSAARGLDDDRLLDLASAGARGIGGDLGLVNTGSKAWFRYWPGNDACIVNLQALIAGWFQELGAASGDQMLTSRAELAAEVALSAQREDGSFPYSIDDRGDFVDAFHSGFVLEGLARFLESRRDHSDSVVRAAIDRGMEFLRSRMIAPLGLPRRSPDGPVVRDGQNVGQLIQTLVRCGDGQAQHLPVRTWREWAKGSPLAEGTRQRVDTLSLRWDVGPMVLASAHLAEALAAGR